MTELTDDLKKHLINFQHISSKFGDDERNNKELSEVLSHLKHKNEILKDNYDKSIEQLKSLRQICNGQQKKISELYHFEKQCEILTEENNSLEKCIQNLKDKNTAIEVKNTEIIADYIFKHKAELEDNEDHFKNRERELQENLEVLQASFDLTVFEKDNEMKNLKTKYDQQLTAAAEKEQQLKNELFRVNNQLTSSTAVLQKKIHELEQKVKTVDRDKSLFNMSKGDFISANNVWKNYSNVLPSNHTTIDKNSQIQTQNRNALVRNVSRSIETNTTKKFQFRKSRLLSESFDPFKMNKQMNANNPIEQQNNDINATNSLIRGESYDIIDENSENSTRSQDGSKIDDSEIDELNTELRYIQQTPKDNKKSTSPSVKKRKLFNPRNMDYLNN